MRGHYAFAVLAVATLLLYAATPMAAQPTAPRMRLVEELRIDGAKEDFSDPLGFLLVSRTGRLAFADRPGFQVRFYDARGRHLTDFGRKGSGPGEFEAVTGRSGQRAEFDGGFVDDSLWIYERDKRRITLVSPQGKLLRSAMMPDFRSASASETASRRLMSFVPLAIYADGSMLGTGKIGMFTSVQYPGGSSISTQTSAHNEMIVMPASGKSHRSLAIMPPAQPGVSVTDPTSGRVMSFAVPLSARPLDGVAPDGNRFVVVTTQATAKTGAGAFTLQVISATGDTLVDRQYPLSGTPISAKQADDAVANAIRELSVPMPNGPPTFARQFLDELAHKMRAAVPSVKLRLERVVVGLDNSIWIEEAKRPDGRPHLIFDEHGNPLGEVVFDKPNGFILRAATRNMVWLMDIDDDGFASIVRYHVEPVR